MRRILVVPVLSLVALLVLEGASSGAKSNGKPQVRTKYALGCYVSPATIKKGCGEFYPQATVVMAVDAREVGDTKVVEVPFIDGFNITFKCFGTYQYSPPHGKPPYNKIFTAQANRSMNISPKGKFSYHGSATIGGKGGFSRLDVVGHFTSKTTAKVTVTPHYGSCTTHRNVKLTFDKNP